jgi:hypothetical protein
MQLVGDTYFSYVKRIAILGVVSVCGIQPLFAQNAASSADSIAVQERDLWRAAMLQNPASNEGCYRAEYPSLVWESVACQLGAPRVRPVPPTSQGGGGDVTGNGHDYALGATGLITAAQGQFPTATNVKSEKGVGVPLFGGGGILGPNEYTLQLNTNDNATTSVCAGHASCRVWQQFIYAPDFFSKGKAGVFIQYWLLNWGTGKCPSGWLDAGTSCFKNSPGVTAPDLPITDIGNMALEGQAAAGGNDVVTFFNGAKAYTVTTKDSVLRLGSVWTQAEFNVVGNAGGSRAVFNKGVKLEVLIRVVDGSASAPHCLVNAGTTGETNNLNLGACAAGIVTSNPAIEFLESN